MVNSMQDKQKMLYAVINQHKDAGHTLVETRNYSVPVGYAIMKPDDEDARYWLRFDGAHGLRRWSIKEAVKDAQKNSVKFSSSK